MDGGTIDADDISDASGVRLPYSQLTFASSSEDSLRAVDLRCGLTDCPFLASEPAFLATRVHIQLRANRASSSVFPSSSKEET